jgi:hypothetical protein
MGNKKGSTGENGNNYKRDNPDCPIEMGSRLELFVDNLVIDRMVGVELRLHEPQKMPLSASPLKGAYMTVIKDNGLYRAYYRKIVPEYSGKQEDGHTGERTCYAESRDGIIWEEPDLALFGDNDVKNAIWKEPPFAHNFSPFLDTNPNVPEDERYKALAGLKPTGLCAFASKDGIHWHRMSDKPGIEHNKDLHGDGAFDSQNVAFWSQAENCYVAYFRHFKTPHGGLRTISRATSKDFMRWNDESATFITPNLPGEQLYTNQTHPYFRAPHIYIALPTRFAHGKVKGEPVWENGILQNLGSTDIMFMSSRAGANLYTRLSKEAFIRPGLDTQNWENRANYVALNIVPTGIGEVSIYNRNGDRYTLRTDGFVSLHASYEEGEMITKPIIFKGREMVLNISTSIAGYARVEIQKPDGKPLPGFSLNDCVPVVDNAVERVVSWKKGSDVSRYAGMPVRIRFEMKESDIFSFKFRP